MDENIEDTKAARLAIATAMAAGILSGGRDLVLEVLGYLPPNEPTHIHKLVAQAAFVQADALMLCAEFIPEPVPPPPAPAVMTHEQKIKIEHFHRFYVAARDLSMNPLMPEGARIILSELVSNYETDSEELPF